MNLSDLFKKSFLETAVQDLTLGRILLTLGLAFAIGLFLYFVYKRTFRGVLYSHSFNVSLVAIAMVTAFIIMAVTSNVVLSLGMVGALSIVRFRTAVKDPMDLIFLFWSISIGIVTGAGLYVLALLGSLVIGLVLFYLSRVPAGPKPYLLIVQAHDDAADASIRDEIGKSRNRFAVKSKTIAAGGIETTYEIRLKDGAGELVRAIAALKGVGNAVLVAYNGDYVA